MRTTSLLLALLFLLACQESAPKQTSNSEEQTTQKSIPISELRVAEKSELAKLMRIMEAHADSAARALQNGAELPLFPEAITTLTSATPTKDMHIDPVTFPAFAVNYQQMVKDLYAAPEAERTEAYDMLIHSCENCHHAHCPGPLMKIETMYLEDSTP